MSLKGSHIHIDAIRTQVCVNYQDEDVLREECKEGREFGFTGKQAIHPSQIDIIQEMFLPDPKGKLYIDGWILLIGCLQSIHVVG